MDVRAAVAFAPGKPLEVADVKLDGPRAGEVLVEIKATGICHTDEFTLSGADPEGLFPAILGDEGAGIVVDVAAGVTSVQKGDHVIPLYTPECRQCPSCLSRKTNLCTAIRATQGQGMMPDGTSRFSLDGKKVHHYMGCSTFSNFTVLPEMAVAKIRADAPLDKVCYIGCGITTGIGAVMNTAKVEPGAKCVVFGLGGIGLNVIQGLRRCRHDHRRRSQPGQEGLGRTFWHDVLRQPGRGRRRSRCPSREFDQERRRPVGGADCTFECVGNVKLMRAALESCHRGWGESIIIGVAGSGQEIATRPFQLMTGRVWRAPPSAAHAAAPTYRRSSTGTRRERSRSTR